MRLFLMPFVWILELVLILLVFAIGTCSPRVGLVLSEWFQAHLPDRDWYYDHGGTASRAREEQSPRP